MRGLWLVLGQLGLLVLAIAAAFVLAGVWLFGVIFVIEEFSGRPLLVGGIVLLACAFVFLCFRGAGAASRPIIRLPSAAALLLLSCAAGIASLELIPVGGVMWATGDGSWQDYCWLATGMLLVAFAAAGIRRAFGWRVRYWIMLIATGGGVALALFAVALGIFLG